ncbi:MAG: hypothetical protein V4596_10930 [Bdellovibrionota bacterium]
MSFFIKFSVIIIFLIQSIHVYAHDGDGYQKPPQDVKSLLDQFHHDIEHGEDSENKTKLNSVMSQWLANFNLVRISMDVHRSVQMKYHQDDGKNEYIKNFPVLASFYFLSHTIEVLSGPMGVYLASELGMGSAAKMMIGTVGAIITIPGLDPLCILLFAISPLKPVQRMMTGIRIVAVKISGGISNRFHLKQAMAKIFENKDRLSEIINNSSDTNMNLIYDAKRDVMLRQMIVKSPEGKAYLALTFDQKNGKTWLESLEVLNQTILNQNKKSLDLILNQFNWSVRYALSKAIKSPRKTFYTHSVSTTSNSTNIQFKDYAVLLKPKIRLRSQAQNETEKDTVACKGLFQ